ncbi:MAG: CAP domain-containing protein [Dehalococcoidia bacterium]|nr:CAP domain-containing protein [Dehalococcoidia bacterium]MCB9486081.1 CAP domain-containing protein [Thermoflexaceae bacterium]
MRAPGTLFAGLLLLFAAGVAAVVDQPAAVAAGNCSSTDPSLDAEEIAFYLLINQYRANNGLKPLTISTHLTRSAAWMAQDMAMRGYFSHTDSFGLAPTQRVMQCGYTDQAGENIAAGTSWSSALSVFEGWRHSPGHNANMLSPIYVNIGIGRYFDANAPYGWYWVTDFGISFDGTDGSDIRIAESGVRNTDVRAGQFNTVTVLPGGVRVQDLPGWTVWDPLPNGNWQQWGPRDYIPGGTVVGLMPTGMSMDKGRNPR